MVIIYVILAFLVGALVGSFFGGGDSPAQEVIETRKPDAKDRQKIIDLLGKKREIANHDVQKALKVSASTAVRYLDRMEKAGLIKQHGDTGRSTYYTKK